MPRVVITPEPESNLRNTLSPIEIFRNLHQHKELIVTTALRDYSATYRGTFLGSAWNILSPLILLALFTFVFGYIFNGRFTANPDETSTDFALSLFVGLAFYLCIGNALTQAPTYLLSNTTYIRTIGFPIEVLPVASTIILGFNLIISILLCMAAHLIANGTFHITAFFLIIHFTIILLMAGGLYFILSAIGLFFRDLPAITSPMSMVLMFLSGVFFSIDNLPSHLKILFLINPLAIVISQARQVLLLGEVPDLWLALMLFLGSLLFFIVGYAIFNRLKFVFADLV